MLHFDTRFLVRVLGNRVLKFNTRFLVRVPWTTGVGASARDAPPVAPAPQPVVPEQFFRDLARAAAAALGPLAAVIVEDAVDAHGVTVDAFPRSRAGHLVEAIAREIKDDRRRAEFQAQMLRILRELQKAA